VSSLVRPLNRIKLRGEVFGVYSKVYTLCYSQNGKTERLHLKNAILLTNVSVGGLHAQYPECSLADVRSWYRGLVILGYTITQLILRRDYGKSRECTSAASR
jgi:hypothetical protein